ncbi:hypothetical protein [Halovivax cerinus]|uniref:Hydrolase n=1 Tax=Halovivax cerinus TaxID=1487865 RepID=A0ABD5NPG6_9EURY|nr:hypothetical protein [Halovivax cerinus]
MATSERSPRPAHTADTETATEVDGVGMAHVTVVPSNFDGSGDDS